MHNIGQDVCVCGTVHKIEITVDEITYHIGGGIKISVPLEDDGDL